jgi:hypothetical protein
MKAHFRLLPLELKRNEENLLNIDTVYGVLMPPGSVSKQLWPLTPRMVCCDA